MWRPRQGLLSPRFVLVDQPWHSYDGSLWGWKNNIQHLCKRRLAGNPKAKTGSKTKQPQKRTQLGMESAEAKREVEYLNKFLEKAEESKRCHFM